MRLFTLFFAVLLAVAIAQEVSETDAQPTVTVPDPSPTEPEPTFTPAPDPDTTEPSVPTPTPSTAAPPTGGGATCVQDCLSQAAQRAGCSSSADFACVCKSSSYLPDARGCFSSSNCDASAISDAVRDRDTACRVPGTSSDVQQTSNAPAPTAPPASSTRARPASLTSMTSRTQVFSSGEVVTFDGKATTLTSGFSSIQTGQAGEFATGTPVPPIASNAASPRWGSSGAMALLGAVAVLV